MNINSPVEKLPSIGHMYTTRLTRLNISTIKDLLFHIPSRYLDYRKGINIKLLKEGELATIKASVDSIKNVYTHSGKNIQFASVSDKTGSAQIVWFNQRFLTTSIKKGGFFSFSGKVDRFNSKLSLISPDYENIEGKSDTLHTGRLVPVYPETSKVSSKWLRGKVSAALALTENEVEEYLPADLLRKFGYPDIIESLKTVHFPEKLSSVAPAKARLAFDELLFFELNSMYRKGDWKQIHTAHGLKVDKKIFAEFIKILSFEPTKSQTEAIKDILSDLEAKVPMNRLLEGDVGSGKTVVAAAGAFAAFANGFQTVFMAPTEILAMQHFNTLKHIFEPFKVRVTLVTGNSVQKDIGRTDIFIGTHALIEKKLTFENVALVVIDEQHRFGVEQRAHLVKKTGKKRRAPHVLTMTATPIPRTVVLTVYGDLDLSTLKELPKGRQEITTWLVPPQKREGAYSWIKKEITTKNIQVFVICPLIEESQVETMKQVRAVTAEYEELKSIFSEFSVGLLHGKQKSAIKNEVLEQFKSGAIQILVATPVVEVGIDVPNATIMLIEGSERFGLAQLHQLRGRIGRGSKKSFCLLFTESRSAKAKNRLKALRENKSGFELAELDLQLRGPGEVLGTKQHGYPELKVATWTDTSLIERARDIAKDVISHPDKYPALTKKISSDSIAPN